MIAGMMAALLLVQPMQAFAHKNDIGYQTKKVQGKSVTIVTVNAKSKDLTFGVAKGNDQRVGWEKFENIIKRKKPIAAINGNFFNAYTKNLQEMVPYGYIYDNGVELNNGATLNQGSFAVLKDGTFVIDNAENIILENVMTMIEAGPLLLKDGEIAFDPSRNKSEDKIKLNAAQRSGIGIRSDGKILLVTCPSVKTLDFAKIMKELGCTSATNLDGGASSALYAKGKYLTKPGRNLNTVLCVYDSTQK
ncbi:MAG: phosphodiester glycosidase family protein [Peptostreptococcaceae bacterium]|nr:phosphodiester glycosidase family protein [Peptostreptococcaceae bacterium]